MQKNEEPIVIGGLQLDDIRELANDSLHGPWQVGGSIPGSEGSMFHEIDAFDELGEVTHGGFAQVVVQMEHADAVDPALVKAASLMAFMNPVNVLALLNHIDSLNAKVVEQSDYLGRFTIEVEKLLCTALKKEWSATTSIEFLADKIARRLDLYEENAKAQTQEISRLGRVYGQVPTGATHLDEFGNFYMVPPFGQEDGTWGYWDGENWCSTEATSALPKFTIYETNSVAPLLIAGASEVVKIHSEATARVAGDQLVEGLVANLAASEPSTNSSEGYSLNTERVNDWIGTTSSVAVDTQPSFLAQSISDLRQLLQMPSGVSDLEVTDYAFRAIQSTGSVVGELQKQIAVLAEENTKLVKDAERTTTGLAAVGVLLNQIAER